LRCGITHGAVRWKTWSLPTLGWISGTNWIAEAPVPITATRSPVRSCSQSHWAEWNAVPSKLSSPGTSGNDGSDSGPWAAIRTSAVSGPLEVSILQSCSSSSQLALSSSVSKRMCGITP
jgi:hypothetical protein